MLEIVSSLKFSQTLNAATTEYLLTVEPDGTVSYKDGNTTYLKSITLGLPSVLYASSSLNLTPANNAQSLGLAVQTAATVFAAPAVVNGTPSFRALQEIDIPGLDAAKIITGTFSDSFISSASVWNAKQEALVSGTNIKTIGSTSLLGAGDIPLSYLNYWTLSGDNVYRNTGKVFINSASDFGAYNLQVSGDSYFSGNVFLPSVAAAHIYKQANDVSTLIRATRSDNSQQGLFRYNGWGDFTFSNSVGIGYDLSGSAQGTGNLSISNSMSIGALPLSYISALISRSITGSTTAFGVYQNGTVQSGVTSAAVGFRNTITTAAATFTLTDYYSFQADANTLGAGSTITTVTGFRASSSLGTAGTTAFGFLGQIATGTGKWNLYMDGTAKNYLRGKLIVGTVNTEQPYQVYVETGTDSNDAGYFRGKLGQAFVKSQIVFADANGVLTAATGANIATLLGSSASAAYILNQNASVQSANFWISGIGGIGMYDANYSLSVLGTSLFTKNVYGDPTTENGYRIKLRDYGGTTNDAGIGIHADSGAIWFNNIVGAGYYWSNGTGGEIARLDGSGNFGIGASPNSRLHVRATANARIWLDNTTSNSAYTYFEVNTAATPYLAVQAGDSLNYRNIHLNGLGGNVVIGSNSAYTADKFQVNGGIYGTTLTGTTVLLKTVAGVITRAESTDLTGLVGDYYIKNQIASAQTSSNFWISGRGVVGTTDQATYKFVIDSGSTTGSGLYVSGKIFATDDIQSYSDRKLKENFKNIVIGNKLKNFQIKQYNKIGSERLQIGVIAQDLAKVFPQLVSKEGDYFGVSYNGVATLALGLGIENKSEIEELKEKIVSLQKEIEELKTR